MQEVSSAGGRGIRERFINKIIPDTDDDDECFHRSHIKDFISSAVTEAEKPQTDSNFFLQFNVVKNVQWPKLSKFDK